jgi:hypothetical protein
MDAAEITVVWHAEATDVAQRALHRFVSARGLHPSAPATVHRRTQLSSDPSPGDVIDRGITAAQHALASSDAELAVAQLAAAESHLQSHPELPHAAWLWAELKRTWALHYEQLSPPRSDLAAQARRDAEALAGPRANAPTEPAVASNPTRTLRGSYPAAFSLWLDGRATPLAAPPEFTVNAGPHHLLLRGAAGDVVWAGFVHVLVDTEVRVPPGAPHAACSDLDFVQIAWDGQAVPHAPRTQCPHWLIALPTATGVRLHTCQRGACGAPQEWSGLAGAPFTLGTESAKATPWPRWATWTLIAAGTLGVTATTLAAAGVFTERPQESRFVAGGLQIR